MTIKENHIKLFAAFFKFEKKIILFNKIKPILLHL